MPNANEIQEKLIKVLRMLQDAGGFDEVEITPKTCPIRDMPQFDSQLWITAITMLSDQLEVDIPEDVNIFLSDDGKRRLTIEEIVKKVLSTAKK